MRVLIACEFSGIVREAFRRRGHDAWSCDLLPAEDGSLYHERGDVLELIRDTAQQWDMMIAHPPCTYLTNSGVRWLSSNQYVGPERNFRWQQLDLAAAFFRELLNAPIKRKAIENPIPHKYALERIGRRYTQIVQPWWFGVKEMKATCWWLDGLPALFETDNVGPPPKERAERAKWSRVHRASPGPDRWKERSRTLEGPANAMADQWGGI